MDARKLYQQFTNLRQVGFFDCTIVCENAQVQCHKFILCALCPTFIGLINDEAHSRVILPTIPAEILVPIIDFLYTGNLTYHGENRGQFESFVRYLGILNVFPDILQTSVGMFYFFLKKNVIKQ